MHCTRTRWLHLCWMMLLWPLMVFAQSPDRILYNGKVLTVDQKFSTAQAIAIRGERPGGQVPLSGGFDLTSVPNSGQWPQVTASTPVNDGNGWGWKVTLAAPSGNSALAALTFDATVVCVNNS